MPPVKPMLAKALDQLPDGELSLEPKWDGFRCIVFRDGDEIVLGSRNQKPFNRYFPELMDPLRASLPERCVVDGELIVELDGKLDIDALGQRIHPAESRVNMLAEQTPVSFIAFDCLSDGESDLMSSPFHERRAVLRALPWAILLFAAGLSFGFWVVVPLALPILMSWIPAEVAAPTITLQEYLSLLQVLTLLLGVVFELPILMWLVVRAGLVEVATLSASRRVSIIVMLIAAAMLTPPDVITQLLVVAPMIVLYEVGLILARRAEAARERALL